jgi:hypothetical protein
MVYTVYKTTNLVNGRYYIGVHKTKDPYDRYLGSGSILKKAIAKYGVHEFQKSILFIYPDSTSAYGKEFELLTVLKGDPFCYNLIDGGAGGWEGANRLPGEWRSQKRPVETGRRISAAKLGKKFPKLSTALKGVAKSEQAKARMSVSAKQRAKRPECLSQLQRNGYTSLLQGHLRPGRPSDSAIEKIRQKAIGRPVSEETRQKRSARNRERSPEFNSWCVRKRWAATKGVPFSEPKPQVYLEQSNAA